MDADFRASLDSSFKKPSYHGNAADRQSISLPLWGLDQLSAETDPYLKQ